MQVKIEHLSYLREIEKCKSISAAAKKLYIGQTTLSAIIKSIEDELGVRLFHRMSNGVIPTLEGSQILRYCDEIVEKYNEMLRSCQIGDSVERRVHFLGDSSTCTFLSVYLTKSLQSLSPKAPASVIFHEVERRRLVSLLLDGMANIGVTSLDIHVEADFSVAQAQRNGLEAISLGIDRFYLCVRSDNKKFANRDLVDIHELFDEAYIAPRHYSAVPNGTAFSDAFRQLHCIATLPSPEFVKQAVAECSDVISILTGRNLVHDPFVLHGQIIAIPLTGFGVPNSTAIYMFSRKRSSLSYFEKIIYGSLKDYAKVALTSMDSEDEKSEPYPPLLAPGSIPFCGKS